MKWKLSLHVLFCRLLFSASLLSCDQICPYIRCPFSINICIKSKRNIFIEASTNKYLNLCVYFYLCAREKI